MTAGQRLCLNMIVRNELANLERCLGSVADHIACWVIGDTGSTDGTQDFVTAFFAARNLPGELHSFPFENFAQARNRALGHALASRLPYDYLLLADADMELVVEDPGFRGRLDAAGYRLLQRTQSGLSYWNTRLARRSRDIRYHGVTHEYLNVPGGTTELHGVWYRDHASGSNRIDKFDRDIRLLTAALEDEPENHRSWFYLAQSYRDAGRTGEAVEAYRKRAEMGGWDEEAWNARLQLARCLLALGDEGGFLREALAAFSQRPHRAEPLYDLARFHRQRGMHDASMLFAEAGLAVPRPERDILFTEDFVYAAGLEEEYSIAANYARDPQRKDRGHAACNWLALDRRVPQSSRDLAYSNLFFYAGPASSLLPSFAPRQIGFAPPDGYHATNPSVVRHGARILVAQRTVNYRIGEHEPYVVPDEAPVATRNYLLTLTNDLAVIGASEILPPADLPPPRSTAVRGFEDIRLFVWNDALWASACFRERTSEAWCEQVRARIEQADDGACRLADLTVMIPPGPKRHEKNWMPVVAEDLRFVYLCDPTMIADQDGTVVAETVCPVAAHNFRGGSQAIPFAGGWLALVHEVQWRPAAKRRYYHHRFVWFDTGFALAKVSRAFFFQRQGIEFAAGLAWHPDNERLIVTYGVEDAESWIAMVAAAEVLALLEDVHHLRSARDPGVAGQAPHRLHHAPPEGDPEGAAREAEAPNGAAPPGQAPPAIGERDGRRSLSLSDRVHAVAPFLAFVDSPEQRRQQSRAFDRRIVPHLAISNDPALPEIHCFYEVMSGGGHATLAAAVRSMRSAGHRVQLWTYSPEKLDDLARYGVALRSAGDVIPREMFARIVGGSEVRYFSDIFRYAVLYEQGGLWLDSDIVMVRPFPYHGDYFFNLQWRGGHVGHYVCGNAIYARQNSRHMRTLYEISLEQALDHKARSFGDAGPRLLSEYIFSPVGAELRKFLFGPTLFNPIDWTETARLSDPLAALGPYLNDDRVFGIHLWNARTHATPGQDDNSALGALTGPPPPSLPDLADRVATDKNRTTGYRHGYARIYDRLLSPRRLAMRTILEIGLSCAGNGETPSTDLWLSFFPFCKVIGLDIRDFSALRRDRFTPLICDQSRADQLEAVARTIEPGALDLVIDDGSHASLDQQLSFRTFFPRLASGGWYFIEDLDWQPPGEDREVLATTKALFRSIARHGEVRCLDPAGIQAVAGDIAEVRFFDSHRSLRDTGTLGDLVAIRKRGGDGFVP